MKTTTAICLIAALCLALSGCRVTGSISRYFADFEDFVFMRDEAQAATGGSAVDGGSDGGGGGADTTPHTLTVVAFGRTVTHLRVSQGVLSLDMDDIRNGAGLQFSQCPELPGGSYTLEFTTGKPSADTQSSMKDYTVDFTISGSDLTLAVLVNNTTNPDTTVQTSVQVLPLPANLLTVTEVTPAS